MAWKFQFDEFTLDESRYSLQRGERVLRLEKRPMELLLLLVERQGELVTRDEIAEKLWGKDVFVDVDHSINTAVRKVRQVLRDDPDRPKYVETVVGKGYRFAAAVVSSNGSAARQVMVESFPQPAQVATESAVQLKPNLHRNHSGYLLAVLIVFVLAAGVLYWFYRPRIPVVTGIHQLTRTGYHKSYIGYHPLLTDGTRVYFHEFNDFPRIAQVSTKGGDVSYIETPLIQDPYLADITKDGSDLLIEDSNFSPEDPFWIFPLPSGPAQRIPGEYWFLQYLPDGKQFIAVKDKQLFIVGRDGEQLLPLMKLPDSFATDFLESFSVSPDGKRIRYGTREYKIWESNLDGSGKRLFVSDNGEPVCCGTWGGDGSIFIFSREGRVSDNLWAVTERGLPFFRVASPPVQLTNGPIPFRFSTVSKNGKQIFALGETMRAELSVFDAQSHQLRPYLNGISAGLIDFSKNGQWITYVDYPQGILWRSQVDGSQRLQLTVPSLGVILNPKWSPDGKSIVFSSWPNSESTDQRIYMVSANGGAPVLLLSGDLLPNDPTWSPDGKLIAYGGAQAMGGEARPTEIRILDLDTKQSASVPGSKGLFSPRWSPDGRYLAALSNDGKRLLIYAFQTKVWKELPNLARTRSGSLAWPTWSNDSRYLYVMADPPSVHRYRISGGAAELVFSTTNSETICPVFRWTNWYGLTPDDRIIVLRNRGFDELYALDLEYR